MNYDRDSRVQAANHWWVSVDEGRMMATMTLYDEYGCNELREVPIHMQVCPTCDGRGKHVNPSIDANGLTADDFHEDPDFAHDYLSGKYDVLCYGCSGKRVVPICDDAEAWELKLEQLQADADHAAECAAERAMGA